MGRRRSRELFPWETHCGCATCHARPGERCVTTYSNAYAIGYRFRDGSSPIGQPTHWHQARYRLWMHLWGGRRCVRPLS